MSVIQRIKSDIRHYAFNIELLILLLQEHVQFGYGYAMGDMCPI